MKSSVKSSASFCTKYWFFYTALDFCKTDIYRKSEQRCKKTARRKANIFPTKWLFSGIFYVVPAFLRAPGGILFSSTVKSRFTICTQSNMSITSIWKIITCHQRQNLFWIKIIFFLKNYSIILKKLKTQHSF